MLWRFPMSPSTLGCCALYLLTGVATTCINQFLLYEGAANTQTMLIPFFNYLGLACIEMLPRSWVESPKPSLDDNQEAKNGTEKDANPSNPSQRRPSAHRVIPHGRADWLPPRVFGVVVTNNVFYYMAAALDLVGLISIIIAITLAGSGLFQVIYASVVCWAALFSFVFLKKRFHWMQSVGVVTVTVGLACSTLGRDIVSDGHPTHILTGCVFAFASAVIYALAYVLSEAVLKGPSPPTAREVTARVGTTAAAACGLYVCFITVPNWRSMVAWPMMRAGGTPGVVVMAYAGMMASQLLHSIAYFKMLGSVGAVVTGVMNALRAVGVFVMSAIFYCADQESQCFTLARGASTLVVVFGVMVYSVGKKLQEDAQQRHQKEASQHELTLVARGEGSASLSPTTTRRATWSDKVNKALKSYSVEPEPHDEGENVTLLSSAGAVSGDVNPT